MLSANPIRPAVSPRALAIAVALILVFRIGLSAALPMTGDEAYFVFWGEHPAGGYYDHPPLVGWWLAGLLAISRAEWVLRLPSVLLPLGLAAGAWWLVRRHGAARARVAALLVLLQPADVWNVLITTDTPMVLFALLSMLAYVAALRAPPGSRQALLWQAVAGLLLGMSFLGKYFAALLGFAYAAHIAFVRRDRGRWAGLALLTAAALPAPLWNLWWNSGNDWVNILFNFLNRHGDAGWSAINPMLFVVSLLYLATPWVLLGLWRHRAALRAKLHSDAETRALLWLLLPIVLLGVLSLGRTVGLHWLLAFLPLIPVLAVSVLPEDALPRLVAWSAGFAVAHALVFATLLTLPVETFKSSKLYDGIILTARSGEVLAELAPFADRYQFATDGYSTSATLAYNAGRRFLVFGEGSVYGRQDDAITDWQALDGRDLLILTKGASDPARFASYFASAEVHAFTVRGASFRVLLGHGFRFDAYHDKVLTRVRDRFYRIPAWLPRRACPFVERHFPESAC